MQPKKKIAVILAAHGEAETTRFMENYRVTRQTLAHASRVMPIPGSLQMTIAVTSSLKKLIRSRTNAACSPHNSITREQVGALQQLLDDVRRSYAVQKMRVGPSHSACRSRVQTTVSGVCQKLSS